MYTLHSYKKVLKLKFNSRTVQIFNKKKEFKLTKELKMSNYQSAKETNILLSKLLSNILYEIFIDYIMSIDTIEVSEREANQVFQTLLKEYSTTATFSNLLSLCRHHSSRKEVLSKKDIESYLLLEQL